MKITIESGHFWLDFRNGYTLSVFNGYGSHTENNFKVDKWNKIVENRDIFSSWTSEEVEIAILNEEGDLITNDILHCGNSVDTVDLKELIEIINMLNNK